MKTGCHEGPGGLAQMAWALILPHKVREGKLDPSPKRSDAHPVVDIQEISKATSPS